MTRTQLPPNHHICRFPRRLRDRWNGLDGRYLRFVAICDCYRKTEDGLELTTSQDAITQSLAYKDDKEILPTVGKRLCHRKNANLLRLQRCYLDSAASVEIRSQRCKLDRKRSCLFVSPSYLLVYFLDKGARDARIALSKGKILDYEAQNYKFWKFNQTSGACEFRNWSIT